MPRKGKPLSKADKAKLAQLEKVKASRAAAAAVEAQGPAAPVEAKEDDYRTATGVLESHPFSRDLKIGGFTLQSYGTELVHDTTIELTIGRRYGLIGSNGSGKSSLLKCIAKREVPIPDHMDMFYLEEEAAPSEKTALESVIDVVRDEHTRLEKLGEDLIAQLGPEHEAVALLYERLEEMDPQTFETRAGKILHGLGFSAKDFHKATKDMSGGWRMRVSLARALFVKPTLLLLDEPTNHLDLEACVWLENYLSNYPYCLLLVSHSQDFMNGVCTNIMHLAPTKKLEYYKGNYDQFVKTKEELETNQLKQYQQEQDDIKHLKQFIASCGTFSNLVRQAKSKQKILDKMYARGLTPRPESGPSFKFDFPACEKLPPPVMAFVDVGFAYSGNEADMLYRHVNLGVDMDSRIALVGPNGAGKSTLLKLMCGDIFPTEGQLRRHLHVSIGRYHQHSADQLDPELSPLAFFMRKFADKKLAEEEWRQHIGRYGISGTKQMTPMGKLSDGYKSRIVFALIAVGHPNILLLDEPTNHLDMDCIDALAKAIKCYDGGLVLVSHDFRLIDQVANTIWVCDNKKIAVWDGNIRDYKNHVRQQII